MILMRTGSFLPTTQSNVLNNFRTSSWESSTLWLLTWSSGRISSTRRLFCATDRLFTTLCFRCFMGSPIFSANLQTNSLRLLTWKFLNNSKESPTKKKKLHILTSRALLSSSTPQIVNLWTWSLSRWYSFLIKNQIFTTLIKESFKSMDYKEEFVEQMKAK